MASLFFHPHPKNHFLSMRSTSPFDRTPLPSSVSHSIKKADYHLETLKKLRELLQKFDEISTKERSENGDAGGPSRDRPTRRASGGGQRETSPYDGGGDRAGPADLNGVGGVDGVDGVDEGAGEGRPSSARRNTSPPPSDSAAAPQVGS